MVSSCCQPRITEEILTIEQLPILRGLHEGKVEQEISGSKSELGVIGSPGEGDDVTDILHASNKQNKTFKS